MSKSTFKRYEKKYLMDDKQYEELMCNIGSHIKPDEFSKYTIGNIYYDTETYEIIRNSIQKPVYKEKLRTRCYLSDKAKDEVFLELKKKYKKEVFKRRVSMTTEEFEMYTNFNIEPDVSKQILNEIEYFQSKYQVKPKIYIAYDRKAFKGIQEQDIRITCDKNIRFRTENLDFEHDDGVAILNDNMRLVEIKICGAMPIWLSSALNTSQIYPTSFSKYGYCYKNYLAKHYVS